jgi:hypothetical protein
VRCLQREARGWKDGDRYGSWRGGCVGARGGGSEVQREKLDPRQHFTGEREISQDTYWFILDIITYTSRRTLLTSMKCLGSGTKDSGFSFSACIKCSRFSVAFQRISVGTKPTVDAM